MTESTADDEVVYPIPGPHDHRCELSVDWLRTRAKACRCARRREVRELALVMGNAHVVSNESIAALTVNVPLAFGAGIDRAFSHLAVALDEHDRELIPSSVSVATEVEPYLEGIKVKLEVLTLPTGSLHDKAVLEVVEDWITSGRLRA